MTAQIERPIAFVSTMGGAAEDIYLIHRNSREASRLTVTTGEGRRSAFPRWSPDGAVVAFVQQLGRHRQEICLINRDGSGLRPLTSNGAWNHWPDWSPDGTQVVFYSEVDRIPGIFVVSASGGPARRLPLPSGRLRSPRWSPDGTRLLVDGRIGNEATGHRGIFLVSLDGLELQRIAEVGAYPAWSPDGQVIAYGASLDDVWHIRAICADGSQARELVDSGPGSWGSGLPAWSPDGRELAFMSDRHASSSAAKDRSTFAGWADLELYVMNLEMSAVERLTDNDAFDGHPAW